MNNSDLANFAKETLKKFVPEIDKKLVEIWDRESFDLFGYNSHQKSIAREIITHARSHNLAPSKRVRSAFVYFAYMLGGGKDEKIWNVACAVELVHTAILMQDDFMDEDILRRGQETTNAYFAKKYGKHYGDSMAINVADVVLSLGYETLAKCGMDDALVNKAMAHLQRCVLNTAIGQAHDVTLGRTSLWTEEDVMAVHSAKTGYYTYENPLVMGAILSEMPQEAIEILKEYSHAGGIAFQLQDDILGVFGNTDKTGKSANSDLIQGKATLLILKALHDKRVSAVWGNKDAGELDIEKAKMAIKETGSYDYSKNLASKLSLDCINAVGKLRSMGFDKEALDFLEGVAIYMSQREV